MENNICVHFLKYAKSEKMDTLYSMCLSLYFSVTSRWDSMGERREACKLEKVISPNAEGGRGKGSGGLENGVSKERVWRD